MTTIKDLRRKLPPANLLTGVEWSMDELKALGAVFDITDMKFIIAHDDDRDRFEFQFQIQGSDERGYFYYMDNMNRHVMFADLKKEGTLPLKDCVIVEKARYHKRGYYLDLGHKEDLQQNGGIDGRPAESQTTQAPLTGSASGGGKVPGA